MNLVGEGLAPPENKKLAFDRNGRSKPLPYQETFLLFFFLKKLDKPKFL